MLRQIRKNPAQPRLNALCCKFVAGAALAVASLAASAATYSYTAPNYTVFNNFTAPCSGGLCGTFTPLMRVQGSFTTAAPLPPNLASTSITALVTSFSFDDGLTVYNSTDPQVRLVSINVTTNATGSITDFTSFVDRWQTPAPHAVGDRLDQIAPSRANGQAQHNLICMTLVTPMACNTGFDGSLSVGNGPGALPQLVVAATPVQAVPALDSLGLGLLAMMVGLSGWLAARRRPS